MKYKVGDRVVVDGEVVEISGVLENLDMYNFKDSDITSKLEDEIDHFSTQQLRDGEYNHSSGWSQEDFKAVTENLIRCQRELDREDCELTVDECDSVNHPNHYTQGNIEVIDYIEDKGFNYNLGNAIKYISRCEHKGNKVQDLNKAIWYIKRELGGMKGD